MAFPLRLLLVCASLALAMLQDGGCGFSDDDPKGPGEPCTRSSECRFDLSCSGGVCAEPPMDAGSVPDSGPERDAGGPSDADVTLDGAVDAATDGAPGDAAAPNDAAPADAALIDAALIDAAPADAALDAGSRDAGAVDAGSDAGAVDAGPS